MAPTLRQRDRGAEAGRSLPTGTVTFLITDIEGSTRLLIDLGEDYAGALERHNQILRSAIADGHGTTVSTAGDSVFAVFRSATDAVAAAVAAQRNLAGEPWPAGHPVNVRMGLHSGEGMLGGDDYVGLDVHRAARISAAAHGGQVVVSAATAAELGGGPGAGAPGASGRSDVALRDLGEHRLKDLVHPEHLFQLIAPGLRAEFPALRAGRRGRVAVPLPRTSFIPRPEVDAVADMLRDSPLVTLTGPGGTGKTRLAVETALRLTDRFPDGVYFVDLAPVSHPDLVATAVAGTLEVDVGSSPPLQRVTAELRDKSVVLLVLDNFEHVLDAAPDIATLLAASAQLRILATSRAPLHLSAERAFPVPPLPVPAADADLAALADNPAVALLVQRATRARPSFRLNADNARAIATIAARLDGLPLALELAAARMRLLTPAAIAQRLAAAGSADLVARDRDTPARQRTLHAVIAWSHDLLDPAAQRAFRRFSVFRGGAGIEHAQEVLCDGDDDIVALLESLADQSLVREAEVDAQIRVRMLATIREFAAQQLDASGEDGDIRQRHADTYLALAEEARPNLTGWSQKQWSDTLERDHDNLHAALDWCLSVGDTERSQRFTYALWRYWQLRGRLDEGLRYTAAARQLGGTDPALRARALEAAGGIAWWRGEVAQSAQAYREALDLLEPLGDTAATANARYNYGVSLGFSGEAAVGREMLQRARGEAAAAGAAETEAWAIWGQCDVDINTGDLAAGQRHAEEALRLFRALDNPFGIGWSLFMSAICHSRDPAGDHGLARRRLQEGVRIFSGFRDLTAVMLLCWALAHVDARDGQPQRALRLVGAGRALRRATGAGLLELNEDLERTVGGSTVDLAGQGLTPQDVAALVAAGEAYSPDEAVAYLLDQLPESAG
jgi:predicted ATPase/class 3 adenylate cyclase